MNTRRMLFASVSLALVVAACGSAENRSSVSNNSPTTTTPGPSTPDGGSSPGVTPNAACVTAMNSLADLGGSLSDDQGLQDLISEDPMQLVDRVRPFTTATFQACPTAADWDTAAALVFPSLGSGPSSKVDSMRTTFCLGINPVPPACSDG